MDSFRPFTLTHAAALAGIAAATWLWVAVGRRQRGTAPLRALEQWLAGANLVLWATAHAWWLLPPRLDVTTTLPLQLCHLAAVVASLALLTGARVWRALLYFWGIALSTQALLTPVLAEPPASIWFWAFWFQHGFIMAAAAYDLAVRGYRPCWRDYRVACAASAAYLAFMLPLNLAIGANYGFVGDFSPQTPSIIDLLGPWPERIVVIVALVAGVMALLMLPWHIAAMRRRRYLGAEYQMGMNPNFARARETLPASEFLAVAETPLWFVWREDEHRGWPVTAAAVCLSRDRAQAELERYARNAGAGASSYQIVFDTLGNAVRSGIVQGETLQTLIEAIRTRASGAIEIRM